MEYHLLEMMFLKQNDMFIDILDLLVTIGLIREDKKQRKEIKRINQENEKKGIKKRYVLYPSSKFILIVLFILIPIYAVIINSRASKVKRAKTITEMKDIKSSIVSYKREFGQFPEKLSALIGNRPLRQSWEKDSWKKNYNYLIENDSSSFVLISSGKDKVFETEDDIVIKGN